ncbi:hypothetical protein ACLMJK_002854 [Lecanora helva]
MQTSIWHQLCKSKSFQIKHRGNCTIASQLSNDVAFSYEDKGSHSEVPSTNVIAKMSTDLFPDELFPRKIWQTWKRDPLSFEENHRACAKTWTQKNPAHRYEVLTDDNDLQYIESHFGADGLNRPDIIDLYRSINAPIVKADVLRYMIMYAEGGVYADIDVESLRPVSRFIPDRYNEQDVDMVIGVEIDQPSFKDHPVLGKKSQSFCQWTFMCKPRLPVMLQLIENIMAWLNDVATSQGVSVSEVELDFNEIISGTGPSAFTAAILADMTAKNGGIPVAWDSFHNMAESKLVHGFLVLTVEAFAAGQGHSDSGNHNARTALVKHHYHASGWPTKHPRYNHPIYGPVETCNWAPACVSQWDLDVAAFDALPSEDQARYVGVKEKAAKIAKNEADKLAKAEADAKALADLAALQQAKADEDLRLFAEAEARAKVDEALRLFGEAEARAHLEADGKLPQDVVAASIQMQLPSQDELRK